MKVLIIEDEQFTAQRLETLIKEYDPSYEICAKLASVEESIEWFSNNAEPDVIFQDIALSDGTCFEIYEKHKVSAPVIFTTAYSQYALQSFDLNSIDYLVKPYDGDDINRVLDKLKNFANLFKAPEMPVVKELVGRPEKAFKSRFLVKIGDNYKTVLAQNISFVNSDEGLSFAVTIDGQKYPLDQTLTELEKQLDPASFFRVNRKMIVSVDCIQKISTWFSGRMKLSIVPDPKEEVVVSRDRVKDFKNWLDS